MLSVHTKRFGTFGPDQLALLGRVTDRICQERNWGHDTEEAADAALRILDLFEAGVRTEDNLLAVLRERLTTLPRSA